MNTYSENEVKVLLKNLLEAQSRLEILEKEQKKLPPPSNNREIVELKELEIHSLQEELAQVTSNLEKAQQKIAKLEKEKLFLKKIFAEERRGFERELEGKMAATKETVSPEFDTERQQLIEQLAQALSQLRKQNELIKELRKKAL